jgi:hypothetical protein
MLKTRKPISNLILMRKKNVFGPYFQQTTRSVMAKSVGDSVERGKIP